MVRHTNGSAAAPKLEKLLEDMVQRRVSIGESPAETRISTGDYSRWLNQTLAQQASDADEAAHLFVSELDDVTCAAAMENYRDALRDAAGQHPHPEDAAPLPAAKEWRALQSELVAKLDEPTLRKLQVDERIRTARDTSKEAAMLTWKPEHPPARTIRATEDYQDNLTAFRDMATVARMHGRPLAYDTDQPIRDAIEEHTPEQDELTVDHEAIQARVAAALRGTGHTDVAEIDQGHQNSLAVWRGHARSKPSTTTSTGGQVPGHEPEIVAPPQQPPGADGPEL